jgi:1-acyl-sn-glycerol-3-phosphate acyltransferase
MARTFITTPIISPCLRAIALFFAWILRWKMPSEVPDLKKAIFIGAPHTSNWDFFVMLMAVLIYRLDIKWVGKHTLFKGPMGPIARWFGGIPIDRTVRSHFVEQMVDHFNHTDKTLLVIAPEGTRKPVANWHKGFYYMALNAHIPIVLTYMDYKKREVGIGAVEIPSGNVEEDILRYRKFYATKTGKNPHNYHGYVKE